MGADTNECIQCITQQIRQKKKNDHIIITWDYYFSVTISSKQLIPFTDFTIKSLYRQTSVKQQQAQFILVDDEGFPLSQCQGVSTYVINFVQKQLASSYTRRTRKVMTRYKSI